MAVTAGRPLTVTPYGDPNVTALINVGHGADVMRSFQLGRTLAGRIMHRSMSPAAADAPVAALTEAAGIAWPAGGVPGYATLENLAVVDGVRTVVVASSALPAAPSSVLQTVNGGGGYMDLLLASDSLTQLLGSAGSDARLGLRDHPEVPGRDRAAGCSRALRRSWSLRRGAGTRLPGWPPICLPPRRPRRGSAQSAWRP